tara:strand:- start:438 stop:902 length:465 start_codon:yes stop_codon:yes gene_type:complete
MALQWSTPGFEELSLNVLYAVLRLRQQVFVIEQQCIYPDLDNKDQIARHMLCFDNTELIAYQRCLPPGASYPESALGRVIVARAHRGHALGRELVMRGIAFNRQHWPHAEICISAQAHLQTFYSSMGFVAEGEEYLEDDMPHRKMRYPADRSAS